jgi:uncharacterized protein (DUF305 family)
VAGACLRVTVAVTVADIVAGRTLAGMIQSLVREGISARRLVFITFIGGALTATACDSDSTSGTNPGDAAAPGDGGPASGIEVRGDRRVPFTPNGDVEFVDFFVPHHQMAIDMAQMVIDKGDSADLKAMATKMKADQMAEIAQMRSARMQLTGVAAGPPPPADPTPTMPAPCRPVTARSLSCNVPI